MPQVPTARGIRIRNANDAHLLFYAVHLQRLPMIQRRLDAAERLEVVSGAVFIWEERSSTSSSSASSGTAKIEPDAGPAAGVISGIERWTDGLKWGPSRVRDDFLFYQEKDANDRDNGVSPPPNVGHGLYRTSSSSRHPEKLIKQTYSVHYRPEVLEGKLPNEHPRKWHLTAYHSPLTLDTLADVHSVPELRGITPPDGLFKKARVGKKREGQSSGGGSSTPQSMGLGSVSSIGMSGSGLDDGSSTPLAAPVNENGVRQSTTGYGMAQNHPPTPNGPNTGIGRDDRYNQMNTPQVPPLHPSQAHHTSSGYGIPPQNPGYANGAGTIHGGYSAAQNGFPPTSYPQPHGRTNSHSGSIGYNESPSPYVTSSHPPGGQGPQYPGMYENGVYRGYARDGGYTNQHPDRPDGPLRETTPHGNPNNGGYVNTNQPSNGGHTEPQDYNPFNGPSTGSQRRNSPHHPEHSGSVPPPPPNTLAQAQHHPSHSQGGYHTGAHDAGADIHHHPESYYSQSSHPNGTSQSQPQSVHPLPPPTPQQMHAMPHPGLHQRSYSQASNHANSEADGSYNRDSEARAMSTPIRTNRHGRPRSDDYTYHPSSAAVGINARGNGTEIRAENGREGRIGAGDGRPSHFSPYSRPTNAPGPRQHPAFVAQSTASSNAVPGFDAYPRDNMFPPPQPPPPTLGIARVPSIPIPHTHTRNQSSSSSFVAPVPNAIFHTPRTPSNSLVGSSSTMMSNGQAGHFTPHPATGSVSTAQFGSYEYNWNSAPPPPIASSLQAHSAFPHPAGSIPPTSNPAQSTQGVPHDNPSGATEQPPAMNIGYAPQLASQHQSPEMSHFRPPSTPFGSNMNGGPGSAGAIGRVSSSPETAGSHPNSSTAVNQHVMGDNATGVNDMAVMVGVDNRTPLAIDTSSFSIGATSGSSGPASASASAGVSSKLGPLTPSTHPARDPEDERVLELLSRNAPAGGRASIDSSAGGSVTGGIIGASGSVHGEDDVQHLAG